MEEMSDINEFMSHFGNGFELKWGLALDPDLDKRVKVTILATGFGLKMLREWVATLRNNVGRSCAPC